jgi:LPXTG-motif cell wall-anchored protein
VHPRILLRLAVAVLVGVAGGLTLGASARAAGPAPDAVLTAATSCDGDSDGIGWTSTWTLTTTGTSGNDGVFSDVSLQYYGSNGSDHVPPPAHLAFFVNDGVARGDGVFTQDWRLTSAFGRVKVSFTVTWHDGEDVHTSAVSALVTAPTDCGWMPHKPPRTRSANSPTPSPTSSSPATVVAVKAGNGGSALPVTGAATGTVIGAGAFLLVAGGVLFVGFRRRKVTFTG